MEATLSLRFTPAANGTALRVVRQDPPWRAIRAIGNSSGEALVHLHNVSGGVLGSDHLRLEIAVEAGGRAQVTTIGATRIHRARLSDAGARQETRIRVAPEGFLEMLPDTTIPYAGSRFRQQCDVRLQEGAGLIWWETISAGRIAHGESFLFEELSSESQIFSPRGPLMLERYSLRPQLRHLRSAARMGPFLYSATMYVCHVNSSCAWMELEARLNALAHEISHADTLWGASTLARDGVVLRGMASHAYQIADGLPRFWQVAKNFVWGRAAVMPRKIY